MTRQQALDAAVKRHPFLLDRIVTCPFNISVDDMVDDYDASIIRAEFRRIMEAA